MRVSVRVMTRARSAVVETLPDGCLRVRVTEPAEGGRANAAVIDALAEHFGVPRRAVTIRRGLTARSKLIDIRTDDTHAA